MASNWALARTLRHLTFAERWRLLYRLEPAGRTADLLWRDLARDGWVPPGPRD
jgi:hypothetical protein